MWSLSFITHPTVFSSGTRWSGRVRPTPCSAIQYATRELLAYDNAKIQCFLTDIDTITDLDNYADHIHVAGRVTWRMSKEMAQTDHLLTLENYEEKLDALREFVVNYDYESIWEE